MSGMITFLLVFVPVFAVAVGGLVAVQRHMLRETPEERRIRSLRALTNGRHPRRWE